MRDKIIAGNWKMNGQKEQLSELATELANKLAIASDVRTIVFPPVIYLPMVSKILRDSSVSVGAQNIYPKDCGAFTGEISPLMLKDFNCRYVLVGHSERRTYLHEDENFVAQKFHHVKDHGMIPVFCVGETLEERENNQAEQVIAKQLASVFTAEKNCLHNCIIAYEPVWAIGTGRVATAKQAQEIHSFIRMWLARFDNQKNADGVSILYGGSLNAKSAKDLFAMPDIDGGLVGGASLNAAEFVEIVKCIN